MEAAVTRSELGAVQIDRVPIACFEFSSPFPTCCFPFFVFFLLTSEICLGNLSPLSTSGSRYPSRRRKKNWHRWKIWQTRRRKRMSKHTCLLFHFFRLFLLLFFFVCRHGENPIDAIGAHCICEEASCLSCSAYSDREEHRKFYRRVNMFFLYF